MNDTIYNYDRITGEYIGSSKSSLDVVATEKTGENVYTLPDYSTFIKPPKTKKNEVAIFIENVWIIKKDFRGSIYYDINGNINEINEINEILPTWAILEPPPETFIRPVYNDNKWIDSNEQKIERLKYFGVEVSSSVDVDMVTRKLINEIEDKAKTEKLLAGDNPCPIWDEFIRQRQKWLDNGQAFKEEHFGLITEEMKKKWVDYNKPYSEERENLYLSSKKEKKEKKEK